MKLIIFGSTGSIGLQLVEQALLQEYEVTAFLRNPSKLSIEHPKLKTFQGDVLDFSTVKRAISGQEAVFCALGAGRKGKIRSEGTRNIIRAMEQLEVQRLICQTTLGAGDSWANLNFFWKHIMFGMFLKEAFADHEIQEKYIRQSQLDWTIVRPAAFTDGDRTGKYEHGFGTKAKGLTLKISRADVADFMLKQLDGNQYLKKTPGLSY
ncbi:SDR family oxidoreductase [Rapidithrix thailandica]|uniref:SDR family oxidoreductase n=1 Tax=Rapidithrix thailandica TaxID=413964 RepID=A0AAW9SCZ6_9BACT